MKLTRPTLPTLAAGLIASFSLVFSVSAFAQYMWLDAAGRKVFSDQPPPTNIAPKRVLQQPSKTTVSQTSDVSEKASTEAISEEPKAIGASKAATTTTTTAKPDTSKDKDLEAAKKKIDDAEAAKKKAEQEKIDLAKADNCKRAKSAKATLDSGVRLAQTNAKGERGYMDDASRMVESKRIDGIIAADCK